MTLNEWAIKWHIPFEAVEDYRIQVGLLPLPDPGVRLDESESSMQNRVRLEASKLGKRLWRNNSGGVYTDEGKFLRYGLANDSAQMNKLIKASDLIGVSPIRIESKHIGKLIGQFLSREIKPPGWIYTGTEHEQAQQRWNDLIICMGGDAAFANREGTL